MKIERIQYVLLTGSDLGEREQNLSEAARLIQKHIGKVIRQSSILETEPWGFESSTKFLNQALLVETDLDPIGLLASILEIEKTLGRIRGAKQWTSRVIDIDILCGENLIHHSDSLVVPHKHLHQREFALKPLCELVPEWQHPLLRKSYRDLLAELSEISSI